MGRRGGGGFFASLMVKLFAALTIIIVAVIGAGLGLSLAMTANIRNQENFVEIIPALPTRLLDINGNLITEFASDEKRELVSLGELPRHLIYAVLAREDPDFYNHRGFSIRAIVRAAVGYVTGRNLGGGSTITQQVAGTLYAGRSERTVARKIRELWWALQMERRYTKNEILEIYLNYMPMGPGTYGVETASKYFFDHSAKDVTIAEAAVLAVLLSGPSRFDPIRNPALAMDRQHFVLERMIEFGYVDRDEAEASFTDFWNNFDWTKPPLSAYLTREDKAPWFSEHVRRELDSLMYGTMDYYRDGYIVHTTLNLEHQAAAERLMAEGLARGNAEYIASSRRSNVQAERIYRPIVDLLTLVFDLTDIRAATAGQNEARAVSRYTTTINPIVDMMSLAFGIPELRDITSHSYAMLREATEQNVVEGALIAVENETGYITALIGGSKYDESNQFNRATQGMLLPGSAFKPLYYSAAIDTRRYTAATRIYDMPMVFYNADNTPYIPENFGGIWRGSVLLYNVLSLSLNIPSLQILEGIGFDAAIDRSASLLGFTNEATIRRLFPRVYPLGLGITSVSPMQMARAFAIFGNQGRVVTPMAIRTVEDRNGRIVFDIERDVRQQEARIGNRGQIISPQNAYVMTRIMEYGGTIGTLAIGTANGARFTFTDDQGRSFRMPVAGKTGTTQNWSDAWSVGYTPYYTTAVWFGFDKPGNSLGTQQTGAQLAGPVWGEFMREIHRGLPQRSFIRPATGVVYATVCRSSGLMMTENCNAGAISLPFLDGTVPRQYCDEHNRESTLGPRVPAFSTFFDDPALWDLLPSLPTIDWDIFGDLPQIMPPQNTTPVDEDLQQEAPPQNSETPVTPNSSAAPDDETPAAPQPREPAITPDTAILFISEDEDGEASDDGSNDLPSWNPLD